LAKIIPVRDPTSTDLDECVDALSTWGFDPGEDESVSHAANWLRRLGNNRDFLGSWLVERLTRDDGGHADEGLALGRQLRLGTGARGDFAFVANFWPTVEEAGRFHPGQVNTAYELAHDHVQDFLTVGYFGPGYECEDFEYDVDSVTGVAGEPVELRALGRSFHTRGRVVHYRARCDIHRIRPPRSLSVSLNLVALNEQRSGEQLAFDIANSRVAGMLGGDARSTMLRMAVALGGEDAIGLADEFGRSHPSDRVRLDAWEALAACAADDAALDEVWRRAEASGSLDIAREARTRRVA